MTTVRIEDLYSVSEEEFGAMTHLQTASGDVLPLVSACGFSGITDENGARTIYTADNIWIATNEGTRSIDKAQLNVEMSWETIKGKA